MAIQLQTCNFAQTEAHAKTLTDASLDWTIRDCLETAKIHDDMDRLDIPNNSGRYWDEYFTYCREKGIRKEAKKVMA